MSSHYKPIVNIIQNGGDSKRENHEQDKGVYFPVLLNIELKS